MGLYLMLENIDSQFLKSRFGNENGQLYKCRAASFEYLGDDPKLYEEVPSSAFTECSRLDDSTNGMIHIVIPHRVESTNLKPMRLSTTRTSHTLSTF